MYLMLLNRWHGKKREELGKSAAVVDESMMRRDEMKDSKALELENSEQHARAVEDDNGLQDLPDLKNEDFIYVY
jgi:hypothetical protein